VKRTDREHGIEENDVSASKAQKLLSRDGLYAKLERKDLTGPRIVDWAGPTLEISQPPCRFSSDLLDNETHET
jgi:hypothetical protein